MPFARIEDALAAYARGEILVVVDDERAAQRIYMGSAMTMEPGEFY